MVIYLWTSNITTGNTTHSSSSQTQTNEIITEEKLIKAQTACEISNQSEDRKSVRTANHQSASQDNRDDHINNASEDLSVKETVTNASTKSLEISESPISIGKPETGDTANTIAEQTNVSDKTYTVTNQINTTKITQEDIGKEKRKEEMRTEPREDEGAILSINQPTTSQPTYSKEFNSNPGDTNTLEKGVGEDGTKEDVLIEPYGKFNTVIKRKPRDRQGRDPSHSISMLVSIRRKPRAGLAQNLARRSCKMDTIFHNNFGVGCHSLRHRNLPYMKKVALGKQRSSSHQSINRQRKDITEDDENAKIQITCTVKNDTFEKKTSEGNEAKTGNSAKKSRDVETPHGKAASPRTGTIRDNGMDIATKDRESTSTQLQENTTTQIVTSEHSSDNPMESAEYPSSQREDPLITLKEENIGRITASLGVIDNDIIETGTTTVVQERASNEARSIQVTTYINGTEILTIYDDGSPISTMREKCSQDLKVIIHPSGKKIFEDDDERIKGKESMELVSVTLTEDIDGEEDATRTSNKGYRSGDTEKSAESPSDHWKKDLVASVETLQGGASFLASRIWRITPPVKQTP